jgi:hypothetical protein
VSGVKTKKHGAKGKEHGEEVGGQCSAQQVAAEMARLIEKEVSALVMAAGATN